LKKKKGFEIFTGVGGKDLYQRQKRNDYSSLARTRTLKKTLELKFKRKRFMG
jgi:hypothetical protein